MRRFLPILIIVACSQAACNPEAGTTTSSTVTPGEFPECPHSWDSLGVSVESGRVQVVHPALTAPGAVQRDVPEYHDCQRFVVKNETGRLVYDSLFAVFASSRLRQIALGPPETALPVAEILAWNAYTQLGLMRGGNCLYMWRGSGGSLHAKMVFTKPWGETGEATCNDNADASSLVGTELGVVERKTGGEFDSLPPVARWEWDGADSAQSISLRCGPTSWCTVRDPARTGPPPPSYLQVLQAHGRPPAPSTSAQVMGLYQVKGWYDEQLLAYRDPETEELEPSGIVGRFFPVVGLGDKGDGSFQPAASASPSSDPWVLVGYAELEVPDGEPPEHAQKYFETFGLEGTRPDAHFDEMNKIYFCEGSAAECDVPADVPTCTGDDGTEDMEWWSKVEAPGGNEHFHCVTRRGHAASPHVPGTARWRWSVSDEGMWERCVQGCCEIIGM